MNTTPNPREQYSAHLPALHMLCMHRSQVTPTVLALRDFLRAQCEKA